MASNTRDSLKNYRPQEVPYIGTVYNFLKVNQEGKIVGGCMDFGIYTVAPFERRFVWCVDGEGVKHYKDLGVQYYREGTLVFRRSGAYHQSKKVISITTTDNSIKITTEYRNILFKGVNYFLREIRDGEEKTGEINGGTEITYWTQEERDSLFRNQFENIS